MIFIIAKSLSLSGAFTKNTFTYFSDTTDWESDGLTTSWPLEAELVSLLPVPCEEGCGDGDPFRRSCVLTFDFDLFRWEKCSETRERANEMSITVSYE